MKLFSILLLYFGVIIHSNLTFEHHIKALKLKLSCKLKTLLPKEILLKLLCTSTSTFIVPYGLLVWGTTYPSYL